MRPRRARRPELGCTDGKRHLQQMVNQGLANGRTDLLLGEAYGYGIEKFNEKCKESVWTYVHEWEDFTNRMGYWVDLKDPYITYKPEYMESVWNILKTADDRKLLYK